jgi:hypothetical protein
MGHSGHGGIHPSFVLTGIPEFNVVPPCSPASEIALAVKDLITPIARDSNPRTPPLLIGDLFSVSVSDIVYVLIQCGSISHRLFGFQPCSAVWGHKASSFCFRIGHFLYPSLRDNAQLPLGVGGHDNEQKKRGSEELFHGDPTQALLL